MGRVMLLSRREGRGKRSQIWKGLDYWKPKYSEVGAGNKLKVGTVGSHSRGFRAQDDKTSNTGEEGGQKREEHSGQRKLHVQRPWGRKESVLFPEH